MVDVPGGRQLTIRWGDVSSVPLSYANQIISLLMPPAGDALEPDGVMLVFGNVAPPLLVGTPEQVDEQLSHIDDVEVQPLTRLVLSRARAEELLHILAQTLAKYDAARQEDQHARA